MAICIEYNELAVRTCLKQLDNAVLIEGRCGGESFASVCQTWRGSISIDRQSVRLKLELTMRRNLFLSEEMFEGKAATKRGKRQKVFMLDEVSEQMSEQCASR